MATKTETAVLLSTLGHSYMEIARELYPEDYKKYLVARDPEERKRLRKLLQRRVWRLLNYSRGTRGLKNVGPSAVWGPGDNLDDGGGERDPLAHRSPEGFVSPATRKDGLKGADRQLVEYEQYIYRVYSRLLHEYDPDYILWATVREIHLRAFPEFYALYQANVWGPNSRGAAAVAYTYSVLAFACILHMRPGLRSRIYDWLRSTNSKAVGLLPHVGQIIAKYLVLPV